jgi:hypothetical protein
VRIATKGPRPLNVIASIPNERSLRSDAALTAANLDASTPRFVTLCRGLVVTRERTNAHD